MDARWAGPLPLRQRYLLDLVDATLEDLRLAGCIEIEDDFLIQATVLGHISSYYYLDYRSVGIIRNKLDEVPASGVEEMAALLAETQEYEELPVRHNEDIVNAQLAQGLAWPVSGGSLAGLAER